MTKLHRRIFAYLLGSTVIGIVAMAAAIRWASLRVTHDLDSRGLVAYGTTVAARLPPADAPEADQRRALERERVAWVHLALYRQERLVASTGGEFPAESDLHFAAAGWFTNEAGEDNVVVPLADGRSLVVAFTGDADPGWPRKPFIALIVLSVLLGIACWFVSRHITRRLLTLNEAVERLEGGDLSSRVAVQGRDEVATLMASFNRAAGLIEKLVRSQRNVLAHVSHDLRSPLARLRLAIDLLRERRPESAPADAAVDARLDGAVADIDELERLVGDLLLSSRLEALGRPETAETVDLLDVVRREAERTGARVDGEPACVVGDPQLLARLARNLLENAATHGGGRDVDATVRKSGERGGTVVLRVADRGPGVSEEDRERIFEPYYRAAARAGERKRGVGLGLSLVRSIAAAHGGQARCLAREGGGAVFEVTLPADGPAADGTAGPPGR
jgi:signal transduction histidine kinase